MLTDNSIHQRIVSKNNALEDILRGRVESENYYADIFNLISELNDLDMRPYVTTMVNTPSTNGWSSSIEINKTAIGMLRLMLSRGGDIGDGMLCIKPRTKVENIDEIRKHTEGHNWQVIGGF